MYNMYTLVSTLGLNFNAMNLWGNEPRRLVEKVDLELIVWLRLLGGRKAACPGPPTRSSRPESWGGPAGIRPRRALGGWSWALTWSAPTLEPAEACLPLRPCSGRCGAIRVAPGLVPAPTPPFSLYSDVWTEKCKQEQNLLPSPRLEVEMCFHQGILRGGWPT